MTVANEAHFNESHVIQDNGIRPATLDNLSGNTLVERQSDGVDSVAAVVPVELKGAARLKLTSASFCF